LIKIKEKTNLKKKFYKNPQVKINHQKNPENFLPPWLLKRNSKKLDIVEVSEDIINPLPRKRLAIIRKKKKK